MPLPPRYGRWLANFAAKIPANCGRRARRDRRLSYPLSGRHARYCARINVIADQFTIGQEEHSLSVSFCQSALMRDHYDGHAQRLIELADEVHDLSTG